MITQSYLTRSLAFSLIPLLLISIIDAAAGGGIRIALLLDNYWSPQDQMTNDFYQFAIGSLSLAVVYFIWQHSRAAAQILICAFLLMVNETIFYLLQPAVAFFHDIVIAPGAGSSELFFPDFIAGWPGWISRLLDAEIVAFPFELVLTLNLIWLISIAVIIEHDHKALLALLNEPVTETSQPEIIER